MNSRISLVLEIVSAAAVIVSLIFVGVEIRNSSHQVEQNTQALQIAAYQDLIGRIVEINTLDIETGTDIEALVALETLSKDETRRLRNFLWILFRHGDMAYFQYEKGAIDEARFESAMAPVVGRLHFAPVVAHWQKTKSAFVPPYRDYIDRRLVEMR